MIAAMRTENWTPISSGTWAMRFLLKKYAIRPAHRKCHAATDCTPPPTDTVPNVPVLFWSFRVMVGLGLCVHRPVRRQRSGSS